MFILNKMNPLWIIQIGSLIKLLKYIQKKCLILQKSTKIYDYFSVPRIILNKEQIELYQLYSEYLIYFPNFGIDYSKIDTMYGHKYYKQY